MNTHHSTLFTLLAAFLVTFSACKEEENPFYPTQPTSISIEDGAVFFISDDFNEDYYYISSKSNYLPYIVVGGSNNEKGTEIKYKYYISDDNTTFKIYTAPKVYGEPSILELNKHYFWYAVPFALHYNGDTVWGEKTAIHDFYLYESPTGELELTNVEDGFTILLKWSNNQQEYFKGATITVTPDSTCNYDNTPITVPAEQKSYRISAGTMADQKYQMYYHWDVKGINYKPVIYTFSVTLNYDFNGNTKTITINKKGIFLDNEKYVADNYFNIYSIGKIGNRTWMLEDIRCTLPDDDVNFYYNMNPKNEKYKQILHCIASHYNSNDARIEFEEYAKTKGVFPIPQGYHLATDDDWNDLEATYGLAKTDISDYCNVDANLNFFIPDSEYIKIAFDDCEYSDVPNKYIGKEVDIRSKLIAKNSWFDLEGNPIEGYGIFNAYPAYSYSRNDKFSCGGVIFPTGTIIGENRIMRMLWCGSKGILRCKGGALWGTDFCLRCVKD